MNFKVKKRYSFEIYPSAMVQTAFKKVTVLIAAMSADVARSFSDIDAAHQSYLPTLPPNTSKNVDSFQYVYVQLPTGEKTVLAECWIKPETVQEVQGVRITAVVEDAGLDSVAVIRQMYATNGFQVNITTD